MISEEKNQTTCRRSYLPQETGPPAGQFHGHPAQHRANIDTLRSNRSAKQAKWIPVNVVPKRFGQRIKGLEMPLHRLQNPHKVVMNTVRYIGVNAAGLNLSGVANTLLSAKKFGNFLTYLPKAATIIRNQNKHVLMML